MRSSQLRTSAGVWKRPSTPATLRPTEIAMPSNSGITANASSSVTSSPMKIGTRPMNGGCAINSRTAVPLLKPAILTSITALPDRSSIGCSRTARDGDRAAYASTLGRAPAERGSASLPNSLCLRASRPEISRDRLELVFERGIERRARSHRRAVGGNGESRRRGRRSPPAAAAKRSNQVRRAGGRSPAQARRRRVPPPAAASSAARRALPRRTASGRYRGSCHRHRAGLRTVSDRLGAMTRSKSAPLIERIWAAPDHSQPF